LLESFQTAKLTFKVIHNHCWRGWSGSHDPFWGQETYLCKGWS